jgi:membrane-associated protease RseP (regulator of RpoE activity)
LKFSLGFGPKLLGRQVGETEYLVSAIPLGGYVKLFGEDEAEAITPEDRRRSFVHQTLWGKVLIVSAGPGFNFILAYLIFAAWLATGYTLPVPSFKDIAPVLEAVAPESPAAKAGLMVGDQIKKIDGRDIATRVELLDAAAKGKGAPLTLEVLRDGRQRSRTRQTGGGSRLQGRRSGPVNRRHPHPYLDTDDEPGERPSRENPPGGRLARWPSGLLVGHACRRKHDGERPDGADRQNWHCGTRPLAYAIHDSARRDL